MAFVASTIFLVPAEYVKTRMQASSKYKTSLECVRDCTKQDGWKGLYSGYSAIWVRDMPYFSLQLGCYDNIKNLLSTTIAASMALRIGLNLNANAVELISSLAAGCIVSLSFLSFFTDTLFGNIHLTFYLLLLSFFIIIVVTIIAILLLLLLLHYYYYYIIIIAILLLLFYLLLL